MIDYIEVSITAFGHFARRLGGLQLAIVPFSTSSPENITSLSFPGLLQSPRSVMPEDGFGYSWNRPTMISEKTFSQRGGTHHLCYVQTPGKGAFLLASYARKQAKL